ncbi:MAG: TetR/AcrR family transcriptional regulator [Candidatus Marinimicrobia bacterium]|nr:TetR/AcrR family transcriptional regulator [Candidatus Neomarinimicrobiota bacterium]
MKQEKVDRRVQRTRQLLNDALMALIAEQGYDSITVQNIIDQANLGRSTFYKHFLSKEDLLFRGMDDIIHGLIWEVESPLNVDKSIGFNQRFLSTIPLFRHIREQHRLYRAILGGHGIDIIIKKIHDHLCSHIQERIERLLPDGHTCLVPPPVTAYHIAGTLLTLLTWWLDNNRPYTPETMDEIFQELVMPGVWSVLKTPSTQG